MLEDTHSASVGLKDHIHVTTGSEYNSRASMLQSLILRVTTEFNKMLANPQDEQCLKELTRLMDQLRVEAYCLLPIEKSFSGTQTYRTSDNTSTYFMDNDTNG